MWQPYTPADTSSFTAYNSQSGLTTSAPHSSTASFSLSPYSSITNSSPPSLSPITLSYTPHMIKDILRGTPGFPEEEEADVEIQVEEDDPPTWHAPHHLVEVHPSGASPPPSTSAHHLVHMHQLLNPLSLLLPNTCFSSSTSLPTRYILEIFRQK